MSALLEPTDEYQLNGDFVGIAEAADHPVDLEGYTPEATVRRNITEELFFDLEPFVSNEANGEITIIGISSDDTRRIEPIGLYHWDLVLTEASANRFGPFVAGKFIVSDNITQRS
jgi:hypothetical protein